MDLFENVTVTQFREYFYRDFPFLPIYDADKVYFENDIVFKDGVFYSSLTDCNIGRDVCETGYWKCVKGRELDYITSADIQKAMGQAIISANERYGETDEEKVNIFLHLVAFYLVVDLKNSSVGINGAYQGIIASKSVGDVSESYSIPKWMLASPMYSIYAQNGYGLKYLSLIAPYLAVTVLFSRGDSTVG